MIEQLAELELPDALRQHLGLAPGRLALQRAWPRSGERLALEYVDDTGRIVPGQWIADPASLERVARQTAGHSAGAPTAVLQSHRVLLQLGGADRRLVGLRSLLQRDDATLLSHRPERRAAVRLGDGVDAHFAKVVRPSQLRQIMAGPEHLGGVADLPFGIPKVVDLDESTGIVTWSRLEGRCLHDLLGHDQQLVEGARAAGRALRGLHGCPPAPAASAHNAGAEIAMLSAQLDRLRTLEPWVYTRLGDTPRRVFETLAEGSCGSVPLHRDFHDKQVYIDAAGRAGILDFDTMASGEPALDVANMLVHLELRALQQRCSPDAAGHAAEAFLEAYCPEAAVRQRLAAYEAATRLRLACLYTWRPAWRHLGPALLSSIPHPCHLPLSCSSSRPSLP